MTIYHNRSDSDHLQALKVPSQACFSKCSDFCFLSVTACNTRVISKKLVTAFAPIGIVSLIPIISAHYKVLSITGQRTKNKTPTRAKLANAVPCRLAHREKFAAKEPGHVNGGTAPPIAFCLYPRTVACNNI
jgi:hypothetical protein